MKRSTIVIVALAIVIALLGGIIIGMLIVRGQDDENMPTAETAISGNHSMSSAASDYTSSMRLGYDIKLNSEQTMQMLNSISAQYDSSEWINGLEMKQKYDCIGGIHELDHEDIDSPLYVSLSYQNNLNRFMGKDKDDLYKAGTYTLYAYDINKKTMNEQKILRVKLVSCPPNNMFGYDKIDFYNVSDLKALGIIK